MQCNTTQYNTIQYNCGENDISLALLGQCNQIEQCNTIQYNTIQNSSNFKIKNHDTIQFN